MQNDVHNSMDMIEFMDMNWTHGRQPPWTGRRLIKNDNIHRNDKCGNE